MKICPYCESELSDTAKKCKYCGSRITNNTFNAVKDKGGTKNNDGLIVTIIALAFSFIYLLIFLFDSTYHTCEKRFDEFKSNYSILGISESTVKHGRDSICYALVNIDGKFVGNEKNLNHKSFIRTLLDFDNLMREGDSSWSRYHGAFVIDLSNIKTIKGYIRFGPTDDDDCDDNCMLKYLNSKPSSISYSDLTDLFYIL